MISASELRARGVKAIEEALASQAQASVSVRGVTKYVVMSQEQYQYLRECELEAALAESRADIAAGRFVKCAVAEHIKTCMAS